MPTTDDITDQGTRATFGLYRFYSVADDRLGIPAGARLYVGITHRPFMDRWGDEQRQEPTSWWWHLIDWSLTETVLLNGGKPMPRRNAEAIEANEIGAFDPVRGRNGTLANNHHNSMAGQRLVAKIQALSLAGSPTRPPIPASVPPPGAAALTLAGQLVPVVALLVVLIAAAVLAALTL
jgi:hypothetical protein